MVSLWTVTKKFIVVTRIWVVMESYQRIVKFCSTRTLAWLMQHMLLLESNANILYFTEIPFTAFKFYISLDQTYDYHTWCFEYTHYFTLRCVICLLELKPRWQKFTNQEYGKFSLFGYKIFHWYLFESPYKIWAIDKRTTLIYHPSRVSAIYGYGSELFFFPSCYRKSNDMRPIITPS